MSSWKALISVVAVAASAALLGCEDDAVPLPPIANPDAAVTNEDVPVVIPVLANDDAPGGVLTLTTVTEPANGTVTIESDGTLTYTPAADFSGNDSFGYTVVDERGVAASAAVTITVTAVNDPPSFSLGSDVTVDEDCGPQTASAWATGISAGPGESGQTLTFNVTVDTNPALFAASPQIDATSGDLTFTPADDAFGSADITVTLSDDAGGSDTSGPAGLTINIVGVNDSPSFSPGSDVTVDEDCGPQTVSAWATGVTAGPGESGQTLTFNVTVDTNPALFSVPPQIDATSGDLTFTPADDAFGSSDITVTLSDDAGGSDTSAAWASTIHVAAVNDPPSFAAGTDVTVDEDCGPQTVSAWATGISAGPGESGQTLAFNVTVDANPALFSVSPQIDATSGDLTFTPADDAFGSSDITVTLSDDAGGSDTSAAWASTIYVAAVNDPPSFTPGTDVTVAEDCGCQTVSAWATDIAAGPGESGQTLTFGVTVDTNPALFSVAPQIDATSGDLTFTPADDAFGSADITVMLSDDGGGTDTSAPAAFAITVTGSDDSPVAVDDVANVEKNQSVDIAVLGNDIDPDLGSLLVSAVTVPANGAASINATDDTITYQPDLDFSGVDSFEYTVSDGTGGSDTARVWVGVCEPLNSPPSAVDDVAATDTDTPIRSLAVLANDSDPNWDTLSIHSFTQPAGGVVTLNDDGTLFYTPPNTGGDLEDGTDSFTYVVHDGRGGVAMGAVSISVAVVTGPIEDRKAALIEKCHAQMYQIGVALHRYRADNGGLFPLWLHDLVSQGYLPSAQLLVCPLDASGGAEGGKPDIGGVDQFAELDEGSSYMYEFNMAAYCSWDWRSYLTLPTSVTDPDAFIDLDGNPASSKWGEVKTAQMEYGDVYINADFPSDPSKWHGYPPNLFPMLRCFWHTDDPNTSEKVISNLSFDCTIFLSGAMWEQDVVE